ncbi:MAG: hypothetical protein LIP01_00990 [Tannerellaceae bacterium]|nr:hypothetical protein [Tannerellaceae bacterium]
MTANNMNPGGKFADVPIRVRSWGIIIVVVWIALLTPFFTCLFVAGLSMQGMKEYYRMVPVGNKWLERALYLNPILLLWLSVVDVYIYFPVAVTGYTCLCILVLGAGRE